MRRTTSRCEWGRKETTGWQPAGTLRLDAFADPAVGVFEQIVAGFDADADFDRPEGDAAQVWNGDFHQVLLRSEDGVESVVPGPAREVSDILARVAVVIGVLSECLRADGDPQILP